MEYPIDKVILASQSAARQMIFNNHKLNYQSVPTNIDESKYSDPTSAANQALIRARAKGYYALKNCHHNNALIIAADQTMLCEDQIFDKAQNYDQAYSRLKFLSAKEHFLFSGVVVAVKSLSNSFILFDYIDQARLKFVQLSDAQIVEYLDSGEWKGSVGCYRLEQKGRELISELQGDEETIIGLSISKLNSHLTKWGFQLVADLKFPIMISIDQDDLTLMSII